MWRAWFQKKVCNVPSVPELSPRVVPIDSTKKSEQNLDKALKDIKSRKDVEEPDHIK
jgi:hypothetical protein